MKHGTDELVEKELVATEKHQDEWAVNTYTLRNLQVPEQNREVIWNVKLV